MKTTKIYKIGLDVGSTTAKFVVLDPDNMEVIYSNYIRHNTKINETIITLLRESVAELGDFNFQIGITGSAGYGITEKMNIPFVQEVIATAAFVKEKFPEVHTLLDIGGEDSKMIFFTENRSPDIRMNGSCAGGTGAFIDQIAALLNVSTSELNELAKQHTQIYPIASRCGVFAKTDVQNLLSRKIPLPDIAISTFQAVVVQTLNTLARGYQPKAKFLFVGGPLNFLSELKRLFIENMELASSDIVETGLSLFTPAFGTALAIEAKEVPFSVDDFINKLEDSSKNLIFKNRLNPLFKDKAELEEWEQRRVKMKINRSGILEYNGDKCFLGIDSGSTTTKIAVIGLNNELLFSHYVNNNGNPIEAVTEGLNLFIKELDKRPKDKPLRIVQATSTGYGEDLIKAAFNMNKGVVETIAHYTAAHYLDPEVSFIMDIGGQDMKAIFIENGVINRIELNESCSSGCGSFIQTFGNTLGFKVADFATLALDASHPADLGTRCTVFMNSKVKQTLRENTGMGDISAGLAISVVKNALYKVLKLKNVDVLGDHIVVQGGTFKNAAVHRALEVLTGKEVICTDLPELMGAYGAAILSLNDYKKQRLLNTHHENAFLELPDKSNFQTKLLHCKGCVNNCTVTRFKFNNDNIYYSGNKCEAIFSNTGQKYEPGFNFHEYRYKLLFDREVVKTSFAHHNLPKIGIPRVLNNYENYPFWHTLLSSLGFEVILSEESNNTVYENGQGSIMSDNVCFPAKLVHGHILSLAKQAVDKIVYPMEYYQKNEFEEADNSFMCPVVSGYADVVHNSMNIEEKYGIPILRPIINYNDEKLLLQACKDLIKPFGFSNKEIKSAYEMALQAQVDFKKAIKDKGEEIIQRVKNTPGAFAVVLAGRPYHTDPLINHKIPEILTHLGVDIITEDALPKAKNADLTDLQVLSQWSYPNRIYNAAQWVAEQDDKFQFVQFNSFGCGPDALVIDEVVEILRTVNKIHTLIKIDDISSTGSVKLRLRSMIESLKIREVDENAPVKQRINTAIFDENEKDRIILGPHFSDFYSPFLPAIFHLAGYKYVNLPPATRASVEYGLKYSNNEICYPATIVVGDVIAALESRKYDRTKVAVGITQTGGQCRASSYLSLIKKGMIAAGYNDIPVIAVGTSGKTINPQPGFELNWKKLLPITMAATLFADAMAKIFYSAVVREIEKGSVQILMDKYYAKAYDVIILNKPKLLYKLLEEAVQEFNELDLITDELPQIGIVGEIYIKYNSFGNNNVVNWLIEQGVEVVVPPLFDFFIQDFVNVEVNKQNHVSQASMSDYLVKFFEKYTNYQVGKINKILSQYRFYKPFHNIRSLSKKAEKILSLAHQFGEGWLIPAEIGACAEDGVNQVVSLQPFGCIANHIVSKGIENKVKRIYPEMSLLFLDFDNDISEVNIINRLHFIIKAAKDQLEIKNNVIK